ncbi:hypothetical protein BCR34DRAFT_75663 [Clohesyomyces aquaticus]|uniref:Uncharacterized protein n=1 Tax=Clohesyomyces aquaticus TaxID=1231657 RepID=A0A1Y2A3A3_9PLEO|nr:hypothetical protein BCR34DRAFT_75663 [Clohesyomyces aquaticus]
MTCAAAQLLKSWLVHALLACTRLRKKRTIKGNRAVPEDITRDPIFRASPEPLRNLKEPTMYVGKAASSAGQSDMDSRPRCGFMNDSSTTANWSSSAPASP